MISGSFISLSFPIASTDRDSSLLVGYDAADVELSVVKPGSDITCVDFPWKRIVVICVVWRSRRDAAALSKSADVSPSADITMIIVGTMPWEPE